MSLVRKGRDSAGVTRGVFWLSYSKQDLRSGPRLSVLERDPRPPSHTGPPLAAMPSRSPAGRISACRALFMGRPFQTVRYRSVVYHTEAPGAVNDEGPEYGASEPRSGQSRTRGTHRERSGRSGPGQSPRGLLSAVCTETDFLCRPWPSASHSRTNIRLRVSPGS